MKKILNFFAIAVCLVIPMLSVFSTITPASAGLVTTALITDTSIQGNKVPTDIFRGVSSSDDVTVSDGELRFGYQSTKTANTTKFMLRARINVSDYAELFASFSAKVIPSEIPSNGRFVVAFGLPSYSATIGNVDTLEIAIISVSGGYKLSVDELTVKDTRNNLATSSFLTLNGGAFILGVSIEMDGGIIVKTNDEIACQTAIGSAPAGYFAMGYTGAKCKVALDDISLTVYDYDAPQNVELTGETVETFENGEYNSNVWYSRAKAGRKSPSYLHAEDVLMKDGSTNGVLRFNNVGEAYFTTKFKYSNFDLTFDLLDVGAPEYDDKGNLVNTATSVFEILLGVQDFRETVGVSMSPQAGRYRIRFGDNVDYTKVSNTVSIRQGNPLLSQYNFPDTCNPFDPDLTDDRVANVRVLSQDTKLKVWIKYEDQNWQNEPFIEYNFDSTPIGYIRFGTYGDGGDQGGSFSIDNIKLLNTDKADVKDTTTVDFKTNLVEFGNDYEYVDNDDPSDLLGNSLANDKKYNKFNPVTLPLALGVLGGCIVISIGLLIWRKFR